ncbi:hypothetical protein [Desulfovermiculus halophilus]|uniref:hypothetical protein n=1 Tax=Desulfovermiculus halophilus TaxID=339722 RepID=UPI0012947315|nr:hypothetical protein [Desulfovermiculus halophilus]
MVEFIEWMDLTKEEQEKLLGWEKLNQLEPEHIEMGVSPRPKAENVIDDYMAN